MLRNYRTRAGEIDLIMRDDETVVFVEVRSRRHARFLHPADTVDRRKQQHIVQAGQHFLQSRGILDQVNCRFDVIAITGPAYARKIEWIKDAFDA